MTYRAPVFTSEWLQERYRFDAEARNPSVEQAFFDHIAPKEMVDLVDVGAGTGANCLYYFPKITQQHQNWYLVEKDAELCQASKQIIQTFAEKNGYGLETEASEQKGAEECEEELHINHPETGQKIYIQFINGSLLELDELLNLNNVDVVMANAVFDLFTPQQFDAFGQILQVHQVPFLITINYTSMRLFPEGLTNQRWVELYEQHMERLLPDGKQGMGKQTVNYMQSFFDQQEVVIGESVWNIEAKQENQKVRCFLLYFMEEAILEMPISKQDVSDLGKWLGDQHQLVDKNQLAIEVRHQDLWVGV